MMVAFTIMRVLNDAIACITYQGKGPADQEICNVHEVVHQATHGLLSVSQLQGDALLMDIDADLPSTVEH